MESNTPHSELVDGVFVEGPDHHGYVTPRYERGRVALDVLRGDAHEIAFGGLFNVVASGRVEQKIVYPERVPDTNAIEFKLKVADPPLGYSLGH